jgi:hypothetical protein
LLLYGINHRNNFDAKLHRIYHGITKTTQEKIYANVILYQNEKKLHQNGKRWG